MCLPSLKAICDTNQLEGIAKAKAEGVYRGGKRRIDRDAVMKLRADGKGPTQISKALGISRMHVYRILSEPRANGSR